MKTFLLICFILCGNLKKFTGFQDGDVLEEERKIHVSMVIFKWKIFLYTWVDQIEVMVSFYDNHGKRRDRIIKMRPKLKFIIFDKWISLCLILMAGDVERNPGPTTCFDCKSNIVENIEAAIKCDICLMWYHKKCVNLSDAEFKIMIKPAFFWICTPCSPNLIAMNTLQKIEDKIDIFTNNMKHLEIAIMEHDDRLKLQESKLAAVISGQDLVCGKLNELEKKMAVMIEEKVLTVRNDNENVENKKFISEEVCNIVRTEICSNVNELRKDLVQAEQIKKREKNLVIFNLMENKGSETENEAHDRNLLTKLFQFMGLDFIDKRFTFYRISNNGEGKARPTIVTFETIGVKWKCFAARNKLKNSDCDVFKNISIVPDRTLEQREIALKLRKELLRRKELGEKVVIYKNEIIPLEQLLIRKEPSKMIDKKS